MASFQSVTPPKPVARPEDRIKILVEKANDVSADDAIPIRRYWQSAKQLLRMANVYLDERDFEKCFILYMKLYIEKLPKHHEYKQADPIEKTSIKNTCTKIFPLAEEVKLKIKANYEQEYQTYLNQKKEYDEMVKNLQIIQKQKLENKKKEQTDSFVANLQLELDKKKRELAENKAKSSLSEFRNVHDDNIKDGENLNDIVSGDDEDEDDESITNSSSSLISSPNLSTIEPINKPQIDRSKKPLLETLGTDQLSQMIVPFKAITDRFVALARANTNRNIETCAILAGQLSQNRFTITHLLVPKQSGTSDSCSATNEEELIIEQERLQLITVGWIHTHPTQRSFLSSVDLHTHAPYQKMLPEAIAIVVAPTSNEICIYSLTDHGLDYILQCRQTGFHPHPNELSLYGEASHIRIDNNLPIVVVDYR
ncbi:hypothetical protein RDWZM_008316 [Blomia tropicalis]|uniref:MPN domain-containing protein n=1 Tax=Blomia tropicalis TaxID=40697 RepID=A0A9Q0M1H0_BLOTA|nr:hypothetical protein RDWZM_008316 [Blomia tropicalis]